MDEVQMKGKPPYRLLHEIPGEIFRHVFKYCDGKSLSTLSLVVAVCHIHRSLAQVVNSHGIKRLESIAAQIIKEVGDEAERRSLRGASEWILSISRVPIGPVDDGSPRAQVLARWIKLTSENCAVLDYLEMSISIFSDASGFEWPVWCGQISVDSFVSGSRMRNTARVVITSPLQRPSLIPGSSLMKYWTPTSIFRCEPYNMVPVPPWGRIRGLHEEDNRVLRPVASHLEETGEVAVPSCFQAHQILDIRIIATAQAKQSWDRIERLRSSWLVTKDSEPQLMCCWHDDSDELSDDRDYIEPILDILKIQARLCKSPTVSVSEYLMLP